MRRFPQENGYNSGGNSKCTTDQLKNNIAVIDELSIFKQDKIRDIIRNAALRV
jgi:hypothetical protein